MKSILTKTGLVVPLWALCLFCLSHDLNAQQFQAITAKSALQFLESRYGAEATRWICEMRATGGQPQPSQWEVISYNAQSPALLHRFLVSPGLAQDGGPDNRRYPADLPTGYFVASDIGVDSMAAFTIAEAEARKARIGFDSCDYFLRLREYSRETVWRLQLIDATHRLVGSVYISGTNGEVLRTVWIERPPNGMLQVTDSASPDGLYPGLAGSGDARERSMSIPRSSGAAAPPALPPISQSLPGDPFMPPVVIPVNPPDAAAPSVTATSPATPPTGSIFKNAPRESAAVVPQMSDNPALIEPSPSTAIRPPIEIPSSGGSSSQRIPPPPVPFR